MLAPLRTTLATAGAFALISLHGTASADVMFTGAGTWAGDAAFTTLSAPNASWSFAFALPNTLGASSTSAITQFSYRLAGASLALVPSSITFYTAADGGMFDLAFGSAMPSLSLYGDALLSGSTLVPGSYSVFEGVSGSQPVGAGTLALVPLAVPEPATWALFALGIGGVAALKRGRGARPATSAV